eukprot:TRINITY_DN52444_c0_g1_i1.p1 TRINITY_DN52444_c0_g1~~TRINITY_DN52444_c0_g1_i1.p1  ORF type:complete len:285 (-),score=56.64 TRINITY_DN52444_c0_g1_i1:163-1017(-)
MCIRVRMYSDFGARALYITEALTPQESAFLIARLHLPANEQQFTDQLRTCGRVIFQTPQLADVLYDRILPTVAPLGVRCLEGGAVAGLGEHGEVAPAEAACPEVLRVQALGKEGVWRPSRLNPRLRFCYYNEGGFFRAHCDGQYFEGSEDMSVYTCMFYLDDEFTGGATRFLADDLPIGAGISFDVEDDVLATVHPAVGSCLLFYQPGLLHEGQELTGGVKHILRSDVIFRRDEGSGIPLTAKQQQARECLQQAQDFEANKQFEQAIPLYKRAFRLDPELEKYA